jgi:hypothetical protein
MFAYTAYANLLAISPMRHLYFLASGAALRTTLEKGVSRPQNSVQTPSDNPCPLHFGVQRLKNVNRGGNQWLRVPFQIWFSREEVPMNGLIYLVGLVVVVMAVLSFLGMH